MHIEPGIVQGAKMMLSYGTVAAAFGMTAKLAIDNVKENGMGTLLAKSVFTTILVFVFFEVFPHVPVGVSEVHLILGTTLFLIFGLAPAAIGLAGGLLLQGVLFAPFDLPQYGINVTTLLIPLFAVGLLAKQIIPDHVAYKDISYSQALKLSIAYQGGIISWVAFWAFYGQGFGAENIESVMSFGAAYASVILLEPLVDLGILAGAKMLHNLENSKLLEVRLYNPKS